MSSLKRAASSLLFGLMLALVLCVMPSPSAGARENPSPVAQSRNGSGMGVAGTNDPCRPWTVQCSEQSPIDIPTIAIYVDPDPIIFVPPLTETP